MTVPEARKDPKLRTYPLRRRRIQAAGGQLSFVVPSSSEALIERDRSIIRRCSRTCQPIYWADIWPASVGIARYLLRGPSLEGECVVDLGCGVGVAGVAAGRAGASVVFLDCEADALPFAGFNAKHNGVKEYREQVFDWSKELVPDNTSLLLLADVAYEHRNYSHLIRQIEHVIRCGGRALAADPFRAASHDFNIALRRRFHIEEESFDTHFETERMSIRIVAVNSLRA